MLLIIGMCLARNGPRVFAMGSSVYTFIAYGMYPCYHYVTRNITGTQLIKTGDKEKESGYKDTMVQGIIILGIKKETRSIDNA